MAFVKRRHFVEAAAKPRHEVLPYFEVTSYPNGPVIVEKDPQDDMFLKCAAAAGAVAVISGDHHLLSMQHYQNIPILSPARFLQKIVNP
ncbi:MAG TPA: PIN domain-containing protein [Desulfobacterales bacterium]